MEWHNPLQEEGSDFIPIKTVLVKLMFSLRRKNNMTNTGNSNNRFSLKRYVKALSTCLLSLVIFSVHAENNSSGNKSLDIREAAREAILIAENKTPEETVEKIPDDVREAVEKKVLSSIEITKLELDESALQVFNAPMYRVSPDLGYVALVDGEVLDLNRKSSPARLPDYLKLIKDDFVLDSEEKARLLGNAFHKTYEYKFKKVVNPAKITHGWIVPLGEFFKKYSGLVFTTDEKGKVTLVEFSLSINPKDFSYDPIEE